MSDWDTTLDSTHLSDGNAVRQNLLIRRPGFQTISATYGLPSSYLAGQYEPTGSSSVTDPSRDTVSPCQDMSSWSSTADPQLMLLLGHESAGFCCHSHLSQLPVPSSRPRPNPSHILTSISGSGCQSIGSGCPSCASTSSAQSSIVHRAC